MVAAVDYARVVRAAAAVQEQAGNLRSELASIRTSDFPNDDIRSLIAMLADASKELALKAADVREAAEQGKHNAKLLERAFRLLGRYNQVIRFLHVYLGFLRDADVYALPNVLSGLLRKRLAVLDADARVYIHADDEYNYYYSSIGKALKGALDAAGLSVAVDEKIGVVAFPKSENGSTLNCMLLAHEIGHYVYEFRGMDADVVTRAKAAGQWQRAEACLMTQFIDANGQLQFDQQRLSRFWSTVMSWLQEFASDRIAVQFLGPAFALAWLDFTVAMDERDAGTSHPSPADRIHTLWSWLTADGNPWAEIVRTRVEPRVPWVQSVRAEETISAVDPDAPADWQEAIRGAVQVLLPYVATVIDDLFGPEVLRDQAEDFATKADSAFALLTQGIPPGEVIASIDGTPRLSAVRDSTILLAGWMFLLDGLDEQWGGMVGDVPDEERHHTVSCLLNEHIAKAIEISTLRASWEVGS